MKTLADLKVGDECWALNGLRTRVFLCKVFFVDAPNKVLMVKNVDKENKIQSFGFDGSPVIGEDAAWDPTRSPSGAPKLVVSEDPEALLLEEEAMVRQFKSRIRDAASDLPDPAAFARLRAIIEEWEQQGVSTGG
jgi:hypothetical protein